MARSFILAQTMRRLNPSFDIRFALDVDEAGWAVRLAAAGFELTSIDVCVEAGFLFDHPDRRLAESITTKRLIYIDDDGAGLAGADLIIHPHADIRTKTLHGTPALCGLDYALIDSAWSNIDTPDPIKPIERILVAFGMVDTVNATGLVLDALLKIPCLPIVDVAIGQSATHAQMLQQRFSFHPGVKLHIGLSGIAPLVKQAGLTIGAGGVGMLERLAAGSVSIGVAQNDIQKPLLASLAIAGAIREGGEVWNFNDSAFLDELTGLLEDSSLRLRMRKVAKDLIDGQGASRVAEAIYALH